MLQFNLEENGCFICLRRCWLKRRTRGVEKLKFLHTLHTTHNPLHSSLWVPGAVNNAPGHLNRTPGTRYNRWRNHPPPSWTISTTISPVFSPHRARCNTAPTPPSAFHFVISKRNGPPCPSPTFIWRTQCRPPTVANNVN